MTGVQTCALPISFKSFHLVIFYAGISYELGVEFITFGMCNHKVIISCIHPFGKGNDLILREAKTLLLIHTPYANRFGAADANLAYQNGSLMAESLGVSQIYTGFVLSALAQDKKCKFLKSIGIQGKVHAGMALGMPLFLYPNYIDKKPIAVNRL